MPFDPLSFFALAKELGDHSSRDECKLRTAVGRAYYSVFLVARKKTGILDDTDVHSKVITKLRTRPGFRATADQLGSLRRLRTVADYEMEPRVITDRDWAKNWVRANTLVPSILKYLNAW